MANVFDYIYWRGDLTMNQAPVCDIDLLILARMSYIDFSGFVPSFFTNDAVMLKDIYFQMMKLPAEQLSERFRTKDDRELFDYLAGCERFCEIKLCGYTEHYDYKKEEQFSALCILLCDKTFTAAFRGTDGSLVGWKEDFNMAVSETVGSQLEAAAYLNGAAAALSGKIRLCGHSKGGNLAVYSAAMSKKSIQRRILQIRNFDGPGFMEQMLNKEGFACILPKVKTIVPNSSVVGMMLEHDEDFSVIESKSVSILQHNIYLWEVKGGDFLYVSDTTDSSKIIDATLKSWVEQVPVEKRELLIDGIYEVLSASEAKSVRELFNGKNTLSVLKAASGMSEETKEVLAEAFQMLKISVKAASESNHEQKENIWDVLKERFSKKSPEQRSDSI